MGASSDEPSTGFNVAKDWKRGKCEPSPAFGMRFIIPKEFEITQYDILLLKKQNN